MSDIVPGYVKEIVDLRAEIERLRADRATIVERCALIAEHLNGWGYPPSPELAAHIAKCIRALEGKE